MPTNNTSGWATRLHGHVRSVGILADTAQWVQDIKNSVQGSNTVVVSKDVDDGLWNEYILKNNCVYLCFKRWGGRLVAAVAVLAMACLASTPALAGKPLDPRTTVLPTYLLPDSAAADGRLDEWKAIPSIPAGQFKLNLAGETITGFRGGEGRNYASRELWGLERLTINYTTVIG